MAGGSAGFRWIEGWGWADAVYMTAITLTTVGFNEVHPLSPQGKLFTIPLMLGGVFTMFYTMTEIVRSVAHGELAEFLGRSRMERKLDTLEGHFVICGFGRVGSRVHRQLKSTGSPIVVVDLEKPDVLDEGTIYIEGDGTQDEVLRKAGVDRAECLIVVTQSDADNLYITMSARLLSAKLSIVTRSESTRAEEKMRTAGANYVISPSDVAGRKIVQAILRPVVRDFVDLTMDTNAQEFRMDEVTLSANSAMVGKTLRDSGLRDDYDLIVIAMGGAGGEVRYNPKADARMSEEDRLIVVGPRKQIERLRAASK